MELYSIKNKVEFSLGQVSFCSDTEEYMALTRPVGSNNSLQLTDLSSRNKISLVLFRSINFFSYLV